MSTSVFIVIVIVIVYLILLINCHCLPHPSDQLSERPHVSTTALECPEVAEIKSDLTHSLTH